MKGIILAGGKGTRLFPLTLAVSKQLLPVGSKPLLYFPLSLLLLASIRDILIIAMPDDLPAFKRLLGDGSQWGVRFTYAPQEVPRGLADAYRVGADFVGNDASVLVLGDNIFHGHDLSRTINHAITENRGSTAFGCYVRDPERYGVVELDENGTPLSIEEKPKAPKSNWAIPGFYVFDSGVRDVVRILKPSARGELEITDVLKAYLELGRLKIVQLGRGTAWLDAGTHESLMQAGQYIQAVEDRTGLMIACPEEISFRTGSINREELARQAEKYRGNSYGDYLFRLLESDR